jgi:hypothetical protein
MGRRHLLRTQLINVSAKGGSSDRGRVNAEVLNLDEAETAELEAECNVDIKVKRNHSRTACAYRSCCPPFS